MRFTSSIVAISTAISIGSTLACSGVKFSHNTDGSLTGFDVLPNGHSAFRIVQPLQQTQIKPLDLIWIIDNSGSMSTEAAHVRTNLVNFVQRLSSVRDVQMALISTIGDSGTSTRLPTTNIRTLEINQFVNSNDALKIVQSALCPTNSSTPECAAIGATTYPAVRGQLAGFLRANSQKVLVIVTDDESSVAQTSFKSVYDSLYNPTSLNVFGWIGLGAQESPCQAATGNQYMALTQSTGGHFYNVCDLDWSLKFNQLANNVVTLVMDTIPLPREVIQAKTIFKVTLNGHELTSSDYSISAAGIVLSASVRQGLTSADILIEYE